MAVAPAGVRGVRHQLESRTTPLESHWNLGISLGILESHWNLGISLRILESHLES